MSTARAGLRGMARVNSYDSDSKLLRFIAQKCLKLRKRPGMQPSVCFGFFLDFAGAADIFQVLNNDGRAWCGVLNDTLGEDMIAVPVKSQRLTRQLFEMSFCTLCSFGLEFSTKAKPAAIHFFPVTITQKLAIGSDSRPIQAQVNSDDFFILRNSWFWERDDNMQPPLSFTKKEVCRCEFSSKIFLAVGRDGKRKGNTPRQGRKSGLSFFPMHDGSSLVEANGAELGTRLTSFTPFRLAIKSAFEGFSRFNTGLNQNVSVQPGIQLTGFVVGSVMQFYTVLLILMPTVGTHKVEDLCELLHRFSQEKILLFIRLKLYFDGSVHAKSIAYMQRNCKTFLKGEARCSVFRKKIELSLLGK